MAVEDNIDQLYALFIANNIMTARLWHYLAGDIAKAGLISEADFLERHLKMSIESVDVWKLTGHPNPDRLRRLAKATLTNAFRGGIKGRSKDDPIQ